MLGSDLSRDGASRAILPIHPIFPVVPPIAARNDGFAAALITEGGGANDRRATRGAAVREIPAFGWKSTAEQRF